MSDRLPEAGPADGSEVIKIMRPAWHSNMLGKAKAALAFAAGAKDAGDEDCTTSNVPCITLVPRHSHVLDLIMITTIITVIMKTLEAMAMSVMMTAIMSIVLMIRTMGA